MSNSFYFVCRILDFGNWPKISLDGGQVLLLSQKFIILVQNSSFCEFDYKSSHFCTTLAVDQQGNRTFLGKIASNLNYYRKLVYLKLKFRPFYA